MLGKILAKLERPPGAINWVRLVHPDQERTERAIMALAKHIPKISYARGNAAIADAFSLRLDRATAIAAINRMSNKLLRQANVEYVDAFYNYFEDGSYAGMPSFQKIVEPFKVSSRHQVPVKPLTVLVRDGKLRPIFSVGWRTLPLTVWQRRLLRSVLDDAIFSLEDFKGSDFDFLAFPVSGIGSNQCRKAQAWSRSDYEPLAAAELFSAAELYVIALQSARERLAAEFAATPSEPRADQSPMSDNPDQSNFNF